MRLPRFHIFMRKVHSAPIHSKIWDAHLFEMGSVWWAICCHSKVGVPRCCFNGVGSDGILPRYQMGVIDVYMDADTAPAGVVVVTKNGAGAAGQPAVFALVYPVSIRILVACTGRGYVSRMEWLLPRADLCRAGPCHAGVQRRARLCFLAPVFADAPPAVAAALCRALVVADLRHRLYDGNRIDLAASRDHLGLYPAPHPLAAAHPAGAIAADPPSRQAAIC